VNPKDASALPPVRAGEPPGEFDEYRLIRSIGRGRTGKVYLAHDTLLDRPVAVKFIPAQDSVWLSRFLVEARAAARIQHPNVVTLYRVGQVADQAYLVSEYIRGTSLDRVPRPVDWRRVLEIGLDLARGLSAAHRCGVLHRDIKPGNAVLAETGEVKLLDFGLAKLTDDPAMPKPATVAEVPKLDQSAGSLTGNLIGTPYFIAPEVWRGEEASAKSDLFSLGVLLYELCAGRGPYRDVKPSELSEVVQARDAKPLAEVVPGIDPRLAAAIDRCLRRDAGRRFPSADALVDELEAVRPSTANAPPDGNPYRGLLAFEAEHRSLFFGRRREVRSAIDRLRADAFVLLTGDSGVGKSSLCQAGIVPAVLDGALLEGRGWQTVRLVPGRRPLAALAGALSRVAGQGELETEEALRVAPQDLVRGLRQKLGAGQGLLIYVDQLEELLTLSEPAQAEAAARTLAQLALGYGGLKLLASARSDFLSRLARLPDLGDLVSRALYLVRGLNEEETREAIVGPALLKGARFESEALVDGLVRSAKAAEGGLPILQFALAELWNARQQNVLTQGALDAMGGVEGALARHADGVLERLLVPQRPIARRVLMRLVTLEGTRARRTPAELGADRPEAAAVLEALIAGRLLVARDADGAHTVELAHEALVSHWGTLARWLSEEGEARAVRQRLEIAAKDWARQGRAKDSLWRARQLGELVTLDDELGPEERAFVDASRAAVRRGKRVARGLVALFALSLVAVYASVRLSYHVRAQAKLEATLTAADRAQAPAEAVRAHFGQARTEAYALFDQEKREDGERAWAEALALQIQTEQAYQAAASELEAAVVLGPGDPRVRSRLGELLEARARFAELTGRRTLKQELRSRLKLVDPDRFAQLDAPATLTVRAPGAEVTIAAYGPAPERTLGPARPFALGAPQSLAPGSYLLIATRPDGATLRYPIVLGPGETRERTLAVPDPARVPAGFVFVPGGRFLFGSAADESVREFFNTVPIHPIEQPAFSIAREETTYADWIAYLEALGPAQREQRRPHVGATGLSGQLDLSKTPKGWQLALAPGEHHYLLHEGEKVKLPGRKSEVDWRMLPVAGVSFDDAHAYTRWLSETGKVKGARLCTEREWERAARGADAREFPGGDHLTPDQANFDLTYGKRPDAFGPDAVGSHPASRSPFGIDDQTGNVWEWVESSLTPGEAVARGGSYYSAANTCRATNRETPEKTFRALIVGLRVCADPPSP
jgi:formylglycine-generating enzyme required for sulfatase activity